MSFDKLYEMYKQDEIDPKFEEIYNRLKTHYEQHLNLGMPDSDRDLGPLYKLWSEITIDLIISQTMDFIWKTFEDWYEEQNYNDMTVEQLWDAFNEELDFRGNVDFVEENNGYMMQGMHEKAAKRIEAMLNQPPVQARYYKIRIDPMRAISRFVANHRRTSRSGRVDI